MKKYKDDGEAMHKAVAEAINNYEKGESIGAVEDIYPPLYTDQSNPNQLIGMTKPKIIQELMRARIQIMKNKSFYQVQSESREKELDRKQTIVEEYKKKNKMLQNLADSIANCVENMEIILESGKR